MNRVLVSSLSTMAGKVVLLKGWADTIRDQKAVQFVLLRDHTGLVQIVIDRSEANAKLNAIVSALTRESAVTVLGKATANPQSKTAGIEIVPTDIAVDNLADAKLPIDLSGRDESSLDKRLNWRHLGLRSPRSYLIFEVQTIMEMAMREFWCKERFLEIHSPKLMGSPSESGAELFELEYFGRKAYLAQSPQFYKQMAMAAGFDKIFEIGPVFRANPSFTSRHDTEFTSIDVEFSWIESHEDVMNLEERWIGYFLQRLKDQCGNAIREVFGQDIVVPKLPFPRITLSEAVSLVESQGHHPHDKDDLDTEGSRILSRTISENFGHDFVFVTDYPTSIRPFYHMRHPNNPGLTKSFDLLWKGLEVTTGAQREHRYDVLQSQALEKKLGLENIQFYLDFFRFGCPPHGGYGFGLTRALIITLGLSNVREVTFLPRDPGRLHP